MDSAGAREINISLKSLLDRLKLEVNDNSKLDGSIDSAAIIRRIDQLEELYNQLLNAQSKGDSVGELLKTQSELEESRANLVSQIENTDDRIWSVDARLQIKTANSNFVNDYKTAFGVKLKEGLSVLITLPEPLKSMWKERYGRALQGEQFSIIDQFDIKNVPHYTETSFNPVKIGSKIVGVACFSRDITKQKESEEQFKSLSQLSPNPISILSENGYLYVNKAWENLFGYSYDEALESNIEIILHDEDKAEKSEALKKFIKSNQKNHRDTYKVLTKTKKTVWLDIASAHIEFNNASAVLSVFTDITEMLKLQKEIKQSQANLRALLESTDARIWSVDSDLKIVTFNSNFENDYKTAFNIQIETGVSALAGLAPDRNKLWKSRYKKVLNGEELNLVEEFKLEDIPQFVEIILTPMRVDGKIVGISCYSNDISERHRAELALIESEKRYKTLVDNLPSTTYRCAMDEHWTMEFISDEIESLSGYPAPDFIENNKRSFASIIHLDDQKMVKKAVQKGIIKKSSYRIEYRIIHKNGTVRWVHERGRGAFDSKGNLAWLDGVITDITSRKQAEYALRESEEQYRAIFDSMSDVFIRTDLQGNIIIVTPSVIDIFGFTPEEIVGKPITDLYKEPKDRRRLVAELSEKGFVRDFETVFLTREGKEKTASINAKLLVNEEGKPYAIEGIARDITFSKMAQKALQERTKELNSIFENTPTILLLVDEKGRVLNINKAGAKSADMEGPHYTSLLAGQAVNCVNTLRTNIDCGEGKSCEDCIIRNSIIKTRKHKQNQKQVEGSITIRKNKQEIERHFLISTAYIPFEDEDRILLSIEDISDMRNAEEEIRRLSAAVDQSTATIVITDKKGHIEYVNPQFERTTGYKAIEVIGKNPRILKSSKTRTGEYKLLWDTILNGDTWQGEFLNKKKNGEEYWESANISPITDRNGKITHFIAIKEDITERKKIEEELVRSESELREMNEEKSRYLSILAHDLRGLVGSFHAYSNLVQTHFDEFTEEDLREQINLLTKASGDSLNLLDNLLAWGKSTQGRITIDVEKTNVYNQVELVFGVLSEVASNKQVSLINNTDPKTIIYSDYNILQTIIRNLINNAIKFTPPNGSITVDAQKNNEGLIEISIRDTGIGMDKETMNKLFKLGEKVIREGTNHEQGTGLGLVICKELVQKLGGTIYAESELNKGSRFYFILPVK